MKLIVYNEYLEGFFNLKNIHFLLLTVFYALCGNP